MLVRCDFNVPLRRGRIVDDLRIRSATPTLEWLVRRGADVTVCTHLGRPGGRHDPRFSLDPVRDLLAELVPGVELMDNLRFHPGEEANDPAFVEQLVSGQDLYVNDAFATAHRAHASVVGPPAWLPSAAGRLLTREVEVLTGLRERARHPFVVVLGGPADPERVQGMTRLLDFADTVVLGGPMAFSLMAGGPAGDAARSRAGLGGALENGRIVLPADLLVTREAELGPAQQASSVPDGWRAVDIGHRSSARFAALVAGAGTVFWDGSMSGEGFIRGTRALAEAVAASGAFTVVSGTDTTDALSRLGLSTFVDHVSTGGAATLEFLHDGDLAGLRALTAGAGG